MWVGVSEGSLERRECQVPGQGVCAGGAGSWGTSRMVLRVGGIHRGETPRPNVPRMLGAAYLWPGMCCGIISRQPSRLWNNHPSVMADTCPALPAQTALGCLHRTSRGWSSCVCLCVCIHVYVCGARGCVGASVPVCLYCVFTRVCRCVCAHGLSAHARV